MTKRVASRSSARPSMSVEPSTPSPSEKVDIIYICAINIPSKVDEKRFIMLRDR